MGAKGRLAVFFATISIIFYIGSMISPWWYIAVRNTNENEVSYCWIDGTCRSFKHVYKDNHSAQVIFDATMAIMIGASVPFLLFLHILFWRRSGRFETYSSSRFGLLLSGVAAFLTILGGILTFALGFVNNGNYGELFGNEESDNLYEIVEWGPSWGWFFAIITCVMLLPTFAVGSAMAKRRYRGGIESKSLVNENILERKSIFQDRTKGVTAVYTAPE